MATPEQRLVTEAALSTALDDRIQDTGWQNFTPSGFLIDPDYPGVIQLRRIGDQVWCRLRQVGVLAGSTTGWLWGNGLPPGYEAGDYSSRFEVASAATDIDSTTFNPTSRHLLQVSQNDIYYRGFLPNTTGGVPEAARNDGTRRINGWLPSWITDDPFPQ